MIFSVVLTAPALEEPTTFSNDRVRVRNRLRDVLRRHGELVFATDREKALFYRAVRSLGLTERDHWLVALRMMHQPIVGEPPPPVAPDGGQSVRQWDGSADLVVVPPSRARDYGVPDDSRFWEPEDGPEVVHCDAIDLSTVIRSLEPDAVRVNSDNSPEAPRTRGELWQRWMLPLVERHTHATLVDNYVGKAAVRAARRTHGFGRDEPTELPWLLASIASCEHVPLKLTILTARDVHATAQDAQAAWQGSWKNKHRWVNGDYRNPVTMDGISEAIEKAWEAVKTRGAAWGFGPLQPLEVTLQTYPFDQRRHARHIRFHAASKPFSRYIGFDAGFDRLAAEDLSKGSARGYWTLAYFTGTREAVAPGEDEINDELALEKVSRSDKHILRLE